ncbi:Aste57867_25091 [Aphanomyces stellatus]|uniref:Aste57867_25091 protein n=1 Tax=Aphanomyces stellatus TaxID=120398 RepID=A0A485LSX2_9STRA|nr:hypothetical protein As57867_025013 [Aphanomyces stellatus]VFU01722.1 Aste57867_25091 [Aphanomyces stellatus]
MGPPTQRVGQWSGWVYKQGSRVKTWKKRYMVLQGNKITYYDKSVLEPNPTEKGALVLMDVTQNFAIANGLFLHDTKGKQMKIYTDTTAEFQDCYISMQRACKPEMAAPPPQYHAPLYQQTQQTVNGRSSYQQSPSMSYRPSNEPEPVHLSRPSRVASERAGMQDIRHAMPMRAASERMGRMDISDSRSPYDDPRASSVPSMPRAASYHETARSSSSSGYDDPRLAAPHRSASYGGMDYNDTGRSSTSRRLDLAPQMQMGRSASSDNGPRALSAAAPKLVLQPPGNIPSSKPKRAKEVHSGWLYKEGQTIRNWKRRYFELTGDHLAYYGKKGEASKGEGRVLEVAMDPQKANGLLVRLDSDRTMRVAAESTDEMERWYSAFRSALKNQEYLERRITSSVRYSGYLHKKGSNIKTWHRRWFMLQGLNQLGYCDKEGETPKGYGKVLDVCVNAKKPFCLYVHLDSGRRLSVAADNQHEIDGWFHVLSQVAAAVASTATATTTGPTTAAAATAVHTNHKGWLQKEGKSFKSWKRRYFTLHGRMLVYHKEMGGNVVGQGIVQAVTEGVSRPFAIDVHFETGRVLRVAANSERDRTTWITALNRSIQSKTQATTAIVDVTVAPVSLRGGHSLTIASPNVPTGPMGPMEGWLEWEGARTFFTLHGRELKYCANPNGLVLGKGTLKDMRVENFRDFVMHIVFVDAATPPIRVKAESGDELNQWRNHITLALKGQFAGAAAVDDVPSPPLAIVQEGWMLKEGKKVKNWKRRYFVLKTNADVFYYKSDRMEAAPLGQGSVVHVKPNPEKQSSLILILDSGRLLVVALNSEHEEAMWLRAFHTALQKATVPTPVLAAPHRAAPPVAVDIPAVATQGTQPAVGKPAVDDDDDEYDVGDDDDIYKTNMSDAFDDNMTDIYSSRSLEFDDFDDDDDEADDDLEDDDDDSDGDGRGSISSDDAPKPKVAATTTGGGGYDSDGLSSLSSLSDFED